MLYGKSLLISGQREDAAVKDGLRNISSLNHRTGKKKSQKKKKKASQMCHTFIDE